MSTKTNGFGVVVFLSIIHSAYHGPRAAPSLGSVAGRWHLVSYAKRQIEQAVEWHFAEAGAGMPLGVTREMCRNNILVAMPDLYRDPRWLALRERVLKRDEFVCVNCDARPEDTRSMQAHHLRYRAGRFPWEYDPKDLETLCQGCHAACHGKVKPAEGWIECMEDDLGPDGCGECEVCGTEIRYVYTVWHPNWPESLEVGCECCDRMTGLSMSRREVFVKSPRWKRYKLAAYRKHKGHVIAINQHTTGFKVMIDGKLGQQTRLSMEDAMKLAFDVIESGQFDRWRQGVADATGSPPRAGSGIGAIPARGKPVPVGQGPESAPAALSPVIRTVVHTTPPENNATMTARAVAETSTGQEASQASN